MCVQKSVSRALNAASGSPGRASTVTHRYSSSIGHAGVGVGGRIPDTVCRITPAGYAEGGQTPSESITIQIYTIHPRVGGGNGQGDQFPGVILLIFLIPLIALTPPQVGLTRPPRL